MKTTCTAQTPTKKDAFTLIEAMVAMAIVSLLLVVTVVNVAGSLNEGTFKASAQRLTSIFQKSANSAYRNGKRYEVILDLVEQTYLIREISSGSLDEVLEEEILEERQLPEHCYIEYVEFDDPNPDEALAMVDETTDTLQAKFRVGPTGWEYGGKVVLLDNNDNPYSIVISALSRVVSLKKGDVLILTSKHKTELPF